MRSSIARLPSGTGPTPVSVRAMTSLGSDPRSRSARERTGPAGGPGRSPRVPKSWLARGPSGYDRLGSSSTWSVLGPNQPRARLPKLNGVLRCTAPSRISSRHPGGRRARRCTSVRPANPSSAQTARPSGIGRVEAHRLAGRAPIGRERGPELLRRASKVSPPIPRVEAEIVRFSVPEVGHGRGEVRPDTRASMPCRRASLMSRPGCRASRPKTPELQPVDPLGGRIDQAFASYNSALYMPGRTKSGRRAPVSPTRGSLGGKK